MTNLTLGLVGFFNKKKLFNFFSFQFCDVAQVGVMHKDS
jgi:hypothetical protein